MKSISSRNLRIAALSLALSGAFSGSAFAAWNPAAPGQADPSAPAAAPDGSASSQTINTQALIAGANPDSAGYDVKFKKGPWYPKMPAGSSSTGSASTYSAAAGSAAPPYLSNVCIMVQGYAYSTGCIASMAALDSLYKYTAYQFTNVITELNNIYNYLAYGIAQDSTKASKGLIGTIIKEHELDRKYLEEQLALNHSRDQTLAMKQAYATNVAGKIQDYRVCDDLVRDLQAQTSGGGGAVGRGGGGSVAKGNTERQVAASSAGNATTLVGQSAQIYNNHAQKYCAPEDLKYSDGTARNAFQCSAESTMPDGDARAQSVFAPAHQYYNPTAVAKQNLTFTAAQKQAADDTIKNIVSAFSPPALPKKYEQTEAGKEFLTKAKVLNARTSAAVHALASMADRRMPMSQNGAAGGGTVVGPWDFGDPNWIETYKRVFGSQITVPSKLSEADSLRFEVYRRYYDSPTASGSWYKEKVASGDDSEKFREMLRIGSAQMLLMYNIHQRLEENNMMQAAILANIVNPVTKDEVSLSAKAAFK